MGDWNFLGGILEEVHIHSTIVGKIWLTILFIFRMLVLGVAAEDVWNDEQAEFICNTAQPGCRNVCYDKAFPISLIRYWVLQVIFVSSPSLVYMGHALYRLRALEKERQKKKAQLRRELAVDIDLVEVRKKLERELRQLEQRKLNKAPLRGSLLRTYVMHIVTRSGVEVGFMVGQYFLYGFQLDPLFKCEREPCPEVVDCFVSRPTEKTVFMMFMQCIAALSLFLNILEVIHLGYKKLKNGILDYYPNLRDDLDDYDVSKSKKNSVIQQVCIGMSTGRKATIPTAPSGYTLLMEKQGDAPLYPILNPSSAFMPIQGDPNGNTNSCPESHKESSIQSAGEQNSSSNNTVLNKSPKANSLPKQGEQDDHSHRTARHSGGDRLSEGPGESGSSLYPALQGELSSCPTMQVSSSRKPRRVSAPWNCTTVVESNGSNGDGAVSSSHQGRCSFSATKARAASKSDLKRLSRPDTPDSTGESSSESKQSRNCDSPQALSPARRMSLASNASSRRAPTDLQI